LKKIYQFLISLVIRNNLFIGKQRTEAGFITRKWKKRKLSSLIKPCATIAFNPLPAVLRLQAYQLNLKLNKRVYARARDYARSLIMKASFT
jgi:hypothetical protein